MEVKATGPAFEIDGDIVQKYEVSPVGFVAFSEILSASARGAKTERDLEKRILRGRIKGMVKAIGDGGKHLAITDANIGKMPARHAVAVKDAIDQVINDGAEGDGKPEILSEGDGITTPVHVKLGSPIKVSGKGEPIAELEFMASTLDELEDAIVAENQFEQAVAILSIAKPATGSLQALPSWAYKQITLADGVFIMTKVLPSFFGTPESSSESPTE